MSLFHLIEARNDIQRRICDYLSNELSNLMAFGESMAECATNINGQGYALFIGARDTFLHECRRLQDEIDQLNTHTPEK